MHINQHKKTIIKENKRNWLIMKHKDTQKWLVKGLKKSNIKTSRIN